MPVPTMTVPPEITKLVDHLRSTGTGEAKLAKIMELGKVAKDGAEFLASVKMVVPLGTWSKIESYLAKEGGDANFVTAPEKMGRVESRSETQSSIPENTVVLENRASQLRVPGTTITRQLGADVIVDHKTDPLNEGGKKEDDEDEGKKTEDERSPVADQSAEEAIDSIGRMKSVPKLEHIALADQRVTVQKAAQTRLEDLKAGK